MVATESQLSRCVVRGEASRWRGVIELDRGRRGRSHGWWRNVLRAGRVGERAGILTAAMDFAWTA